MPSVAAGRPASHASRSNHQVGAHGNMGPHGYSQGVGAHGDEQGISAGYHQGTRGHGTDAGGYDEEHVEKKEPVLETMEQIMQLKVGDVEMQSP